MPDREADDDGDEFEGVCPVLFRAIRALVGSARLLFAIVMGLGLMEEAVDDADRQTLLFTE